MYLLFPELLLTVQLVLSCPVSGLMLWSMDFIRKCLMVSF